MNQQIEDFIEGARTEAVRVSRLTGLADVLEEARAMIGHAASCKDAAEKALADRDATLADLESAKLGVADAKDEAASIVAAAKIQAASIAAQAKSDARAVAAQAVLDAAQAVSDAKAQAQDSLALTLAERDGLSRQVAALTDESATLTAQRDAVAADLDEKTDALANVRAAIAAMRG